MDNKADVQTNPFKKREEFVLMQAEEKTLNGRHVHETEVVSHTNFQFLWMTA